MEGDFIVIDVFQVVPAVLDSVAIGVFQVQCDLGGTVGLSQSFEVLRFFDRA